jgi:mannose-6-phosphate isomerase-like protein (cupin superfamily)
MDETIFDLRKIFGMVISFKRDQQLISPDKPFELLTELYPNGKSSLHVHPNQDEYYKVQEGELELYSNGTWKRLKSGEEETIPKGTIHGFRNLGKQKAIAHNKHSPGLRFGKSLEVLQKLISENKITGTSGFKNSVYLCLHTVEFNDVLRTTKPSYGLVKFVAMLGKALGFKI